MRSKLCTCLFLVAAAGGLVAGPVAGPVLAQVPVHQQSQLSWHGGGDCDYWNGCGPHWGGHYHWC